LSRTAELNGFTAGFTLIEALVALALTAIALSSISALIAANVRGSRSIEMRLVRQQIARELMASLPDREHLVPAHMAGSREDYAWRIDVVPLTSKTDTRAAWQPLVVTATVSSPDGGVMSVSTLRLRRNTSP
jgi:prepilin-type N-terminal cleavage/methylation domain-containing protein